MLRGEDVLVRGNRIVAIGRGITVPQGARVIDGRGKYLLPGLADMHTHSDTAADMAVYLANGVTTVLNMGDASFAFIAKTMPAINDGDLPGPYIYAGFKIDGSQRYAHFMVRTPTEAREAVDLAKANGYSFIKVYNDLSAPAFYAIIDQARKDHLAVVGHGVTAVGVEKQLQAGQLMIAHTEEYLYTYFFHGNDFTAKTSDIPRAIAFTKKYHGFVTADIQTYATITRQFGHPDVVRGFLRSNQIKYLPPQNRLGWMHSHYQDRKVDLRANLKFLELFTRALTNAGVPMITGTDAPPTPGMFPGYSLHDDLEKLHSIGLTPYQALVDATRTPGELLERAQPGSIPFGTVTVGSRADLLLVEENPLVNLRTLRKPLGVMTRGAWYDRSHLDALLDRVASDYQRANALP